MNKVSKSDFQLDMIFCFEQFRNDSANGQIDHTIHSLILKIIPRTFLVQVVLHDIRELPDGLQGLTDLPDPGLHGVDDRGVTLGAGKGHGSGLGTAAAGENSQREEEGHGSREEDAAVGGHAATSAAVAAAAAALLGEAVGEREEEALDETAAARREGTLTGST